MAVTVLGSLNIDLITTVRHLPGRGETVSGTGQRRSPGGKGANQAVACRRAGSDVHMVGACGTDEAGDMVVRALADEGVDTTRIRRLPGLPTGMATIFVEASGENMIALTPGANQCITDVDVDAATSTIGPRDVLLMQLEVPTDVVRRASAHARARAATVVLNAAPATRDASEVLAAVDVLIVNQHEAHQIAISDGLTDEGASIADCSRELAARHGLFVITTLGAAGALATNGDLPHFYPAPEVDVVDSVGAGDTFTGYFASAVEQETDYHDAIPDSILAASKVVTQRGAQSSIPRYTEIVRNDAQGA